LIEKVELEEVIHYGILSGDFIDKLASDNDDVSSDHSDHMFGRLMNVTRIIEKPSIEKARQLLGIKVNNKTEYYCIFGIYVLTSSIFDQLEEDVKQNKRQNGEFQLTSALESVLDSEGMVALVPHGKR
jgi:UTP--glucose-1-phosphate uridylyltransferase